jgi:predicted transglutaminase-like cysteine proteinase
MGFLGPARIWCGVFLVCGLVWLAPATGSRAAPLESSGGLASGAMELALGLTGEATEPFGRPASIMSGGGLRAKWLSVAQRIDDERVQLALCDGDREHCASDAALRLLAIVDGARARDGRARLGEINRAINLAIRPMSDLAQYGDDIDVWSSPLATLSRGTGDCEDYAIAKFVALRLAGIPAEDLRIVVMRDLLQGEDHAVAAARLDGRWLMLDNRRMAMIDDVHIRNYRPRFVLDESAVMKYMDTPVFAGLPDRDPAPATAPNTPVAQ